MLARKGTAIFLSCMASTSPCRVVRLPSDRERSFFPGNFSPLRSSVFLSLFEPWTVFEQRLLLVVPYAALGSHTAVLIASFSAALLREHDGAVLPTSLIFKCPTVGFHLL